MNALNTLAHVLAASLDTYDRPPCTYPDLGPLWLSEDREVGKVRAVSPQVSNLDTSPERMTDPMTTNPNPLPTPTSLKAMTGPETAGGHDRPIEPPATPGPHGGSLPHAARCPRPAPVLRLSWRGEPEAWCSACGRYAPA